MVSIDEMRNTPLIIGMFAAGIPFTGDTIEKQSLGGSESAAYFAAKELAKLGHNVTVFTLSDEEGTYDGVRYLSYHKSWKHQAPAIEWDVFIVGRNYATLTQKMNVRLLGLWNHDTLEDPVTLLESCYATDWMWCLSAFHKRQFLSKAKELEPLIHLTRNGIDLSAIVEIGNNTNKFDTPTFVYGSRPERGLLILLRDIWPRILKEFNGECDLFIAGYDVAPERIPDHIKYHYTEIQQVFNTSENVKNVGHLQKDLWYTLLCQSTALLYPSQFPEISCINALEAQACGTPVVSTRDFALQETIPYAELLIPGDAATTLYHEAYVRKVRLLVESWNQERAKNGIDYKKIQQHGFTWVKSRYQWSTIVEEWVDFWWSLFIERSQQKGGSKVLRNLMYKSDLMAAEWAIDNPRESGVDVEHPLVQDLYEKIGTYLDHHHTDPELYLKQELSEAALDSYALPDRFKVALDRMSTHFGPAPFTCLDIGCGDGKFIYFAKQRFSDQISILGIDFSAKLVDLCRKNVKQYGFKNVHVIQGDVVDTVLNEDTDRFDCVFAGEWLEHQQDWQGSMYFVMGEWCTPDGLVMLTVPTGPWEAISFEDDTIRHHVNHFEIHDIMDMFPGRVFQSQWLPATISPKDGSILGNWVVSFINSVEPLGKIDYKRKFLTTRPYQFISLCMITKNEEDYISRCLKSVHGIADEIIIIDAESTDDTQRIATRFADKFHIREWDDDFGEARNYSLQMADAAADWILWLDADEVLTDARRLRKYVHTSLYPGFIIRQNHLMIDTQSAFDVPVRLFNADKDIKWYGVIHEHPEFKLNSPIYPTLILPDVNIAHYGYVTEAVRRSKSQQRNFDLLKKDRKKWPHRSLGLVLELRDYINIARWDLESTKGQLTDRALQCLLEVLNVYNKVFRPADHPYHSHTLVFQQQALEILSTVGQRIDGKVPSQVALFLGFREGGFGSQMNVRPDTRWFLTSTDVETYLRDSVEHMIANIKNSGY